MATRLHRATLGTPSARAPIDAGSLRALGAAPERSARALVAFCALVVLAGVVMRFIGLDSKLYNNDEATTSVHVSGKTLAAYATAMFDGRTRTRDDILLFQRPDSAHGPADVVRSLAVEDPQHPPLYYLAQYAWERAFGSSIAARRAVAAVFGVLAIGAAIWFGTELFSAFAGALCGALVAASPFALLYSQEAREYSLWMLLTFASSALLLRALRLSDRARGASQASSVIGAWTAYAVASALGCYTDLLFLVVLVAHALAVAFVARRNRAALAGFALAALGALLAFGPWLSVAVAGYAHGVITNNAYLAVGLPFKLFALKWIFNVGALFFDLDYLIPKSVVVIVPGCLALAVAAWVGARELRANPRLAVPFALATVAVLALVVPDVLKHESRSTSARYLVPLWVAAYALIAVALARAAASKRFAFRATAFAFVAFTAAAGLGSFVISNRHETWWIDGSVRPIGPIARAIDAARDPLVLYRATWGVDAQPGDQWDFTPVMVADALHVNARIAQFPRGAALPLDAHATTFVLDPTDALRADLTGRGAHLTRADAVAANVDGQLAQARADAARVRAARGLAGFEPSLWTIGR